MLARTETSSQTELNMEIIANVVTVDEGTPVVIGFADGERTNTKWLRFGSTHPASRFLSVDPIDGG
jgi:hypothetical protein